MFNKKGGGGIGGQPANVSTDLSRGKQAKKAIGLCTMCPSMCDGVRAAPPTCFPVDNRRFAHSPGELVTVAESDRREIAATADMIRRNGSHPSSRSKAPPNQPY